MGRTGREGCKGSDKQCEAVSLAVSINQKFSVQMSWANIDFGSEERRNGIGLMSNKSSVKLAAKKLHQGNSLTREEKAGYFRWTYTFN